MSIQRLPVVSCFVAALLVASAAHAGVFWSSAFTGDGDSGISAAKTYTHAANIRGGNVTVNGVLFTGGDASGPGWSLNGTSNTLNGSGAGNVSGSAGQLVSDFRYGPSNAQPTLTLTGLTPGASYVTTWYNKSWGNAGGRFIGVSASDGGGIRFDENFTGNNNGNQLRYGFVAPASGNITYTFANATDTYHHYAFSNEQAPAGSYQSPFSTALFNNDADCGIATSGLYTHAVDTAGTNASGFRSVNNVQFERGQPPSGGNTSGSNWSITGANSGWAGSAGNVTGGVASLISDFWYNGNPMTTTLTGLVPGRQYTATWYNRGFGPAGTRAITITTDNGVGGPTIDTFGFDENFSGDGNGNVLRYTYTAPASGQFRVSFTPQGADTFHQYAFTNQLVPAGNALLTESFNSSANQSPLNATPQAASRQTGPLAGTGWTGGGNIQLGNGGTPHPGVLLMADSGWSGLIHNFNKSESAGGMSIEFDIDPKWTGYSGGDLSQWGAVNIGASRFTNGWVNRGDPHFGILFRGNGEFQAFDGGTTIASGPTGLGTMAGKLSHVELRLSDATDGNPFDGAGQTTIDVYLNGAASPVYSYTKTGGGYLNNFINFQGTNYGQVDNLEIRSSGTIVPSGFTAAAMTGDADSTITPDKAFTHALNFNATGNRTVSGAVFTGTGANVDNPATNNYSTANLTNNFAGHNPPVTGEVKQLLTDFLHNGESPETITLKNLRPGQKYVTTFYGTSFGGAGGRAVHITTSQGDQIAFDQNFTGGNNGNLLRYEYIAQSTSMTFTINPLTSGSMHQYALSNEIAGYRALLTDNFYVPGNPDTQNINYNLAARQGGALVAWTGGPIAYTKTANIQVGNNTGGLDGGNYLLGGNGVGSPNWNFNNEHSQGGMLISFDVAAQINSPASSDWAAIALGASEANRLTRVNGAAEHFGILFRGDGRLEAWDANTVVSPTPEVFWGPSGQGNLFHHIELLLNDPTDGNPFDGLGQTDIAVYADGLLVYSFTKPDGGYADNFINFHYSGVAGVDNLMIAQVVPEPISLALLGLGGAAIGGYLRRRRGR